jgi:mRNA interferase RelE/StbE
MPQNYHLVPTRTFLRNLKKLDKETRERISEALKAIKDKPYRGKKLTNKEFGIWRFRTGDYRIRYDIDNDAIVLYLVKHRKDIYKD